MRTVEEVRTRLAKLERMQALMGSVPLTKGTLKEIKDLRAELEVRTAIWS